MQPDPTPIDHVAVLVADLDAALDLLRPLDLPVGPIEDFPAEGTREVYLGAGRQGALLLLQPTSDAGPYARALAARGPGLHHLGIRVPSLTEAIDGLAGSGWYLHPRSLATLEQTRTVWLARPGIGALIEVQESTAPPTGPALVTAVSVPGAVGKPLFRALGLTTVTTGSEPFATISVAGARLRADRLTPA